MSSGFEAGTCSISAATEVQPIPISPRTGIRARRCVTAVGTVPGRRPRAAAVFERRHDRGPAAAGTGGDRESVLGSHGLQQPRRDALAPVRPASPADRAELAAPRDRLQPRAAARRLRRLFRRSDGTRRRYRCRSLSRRQVDAIPAVAGPITGGWDGFDLGERVPALRRDARRGQASPDRARLSNGHGWRRCGQPFIRLAPGYPANTIDPEPLVVGDRLYVFFGGGSSPSATGGMRGRILLRTYRLR